MAKAILVMDMPDKCFHCPESDAMETALERWYCIPKDKEIEDMDSKPDWCPLIPEPKRRKPGDAVGYTEGEPLTDELADKIFNFGFNECLAVIEEMAEEGKENE